MFSVDISLETTKHEKVSGWKPDVGFTVYLGQYNPNMQNPPIMIRHGIAIGPGIRPVLRLQNIKRVYLGKRTFFTF